MSGAIDNEGVRCQSAPDCENCGGYGPIKHTGLSDYAFGAPGCWSTRCCSNPACGLGWLEPRPQTDQIAKFYQTYYTHAADEPPGASPDVPSFASHGLKRRLKRALAGLVVWRRRKFLSDDHHLCDLPPGRLLEVGCGSGAFLAAMAREGWDAHGIDFDEKAIRAARRHSGVDAVVGDLMGQRYPDDRFDAIVMSDVIEHLPNPRETFDECLRILKPAGRLVMVTPNLQSLLHARFGADWRGLEPPRHLFIFTAASLRSFAERAGFTKIDVFSTPGALSGVRHMKSGSERTARHAGRTPPRVSALGTLLAEQALDLMGETRGEWIILVTEKPASVATS